MGEGVFIHAPSTTFPTKAGSQRAVFSLCVRVWVPAFAGKTEVKTRPPSSLRALPPEGEDLPSYDLPPLGEVPA